MSWDLALRRRLNRDLSRGESTAPAGRGLLLCAAALATIAASTRLGRVAERSYYQRLADRGLRTTQETPAVTMREMVYGPDGGGS